MEKEMVREIVLNTLVQLDNAPAKRCERVCEKLFYINSKYDLGLYHAIKYHLTKDENIIKYIYVVDSEGERLYFLMKKDGVVYRVYSNDGHMELADNEEQVMITGQ